jgi:hypothetical protein
MRPVFIMLVMFLAVWAYQVRAGEVFPLHFKPELFRVLQDEWQCDSVCKDLLTTHCFEPNYKSGDSVSPENAPYLQWHYESLGRNAEQVLKKDVLPQYYSFWLEGSQSCCDKRCAYIPRDDYTLLVAESKAVVSIIIVLSDGSSIPADQELETRVNDLAKRIFNTTATMDLIVMGNLVGPVKYGMQRSAFENLKKEELEDQTNPNSLRAQMRKMGARLASPWYESIFWWADGEKVGFLLLFAPQNQGYLTMDTKSELANSNWFESDKAKYCQGGCKLPQPFKPPLGYASPSDSMMKEMKATKLFHILVEKKEVVEPNSPPLPNIKHVSKPLPLTTKPKPKPPEPTKVLVRYVDFTTRDVAVMVLAVLVGVLTIIGAFRRKAKQ